MTEPSSAPIQPDPEWIVGKYALMNVRASSRLGRTEIDPLCWRIPFQWQGYHYQDHDDQPFMLLVNSGGGFVEGDVSHFHGVLEPGTRALFTTTASSKFYKCPGGAISREIVDLHVGEDALLEFCPDEAIPFARSRVHRINRITLEPSSRLFATDMVSAGRVHYGDGEVFRFHHLVSEFRITVGGRLVSLDRLVATEPEAIASLQRLWQERPHMATAFAYAPDLTAAVEDDVHEAIEGVAGTEAGVTRIGNLVIVRILSHETWQAHEALFNAWTALRPAIAGKAARPILKC
ncbi:MAG: urease accessory protein UreD [Rhodospirillales bacterium]|nr:urease accessory protein UreD [Rhodospirillales bacterium]